MSTLGSVSAVDTVTVLLLIIPIGEVGAPTLPLPPHFSIGASVTYPGWREKGWGMMA